MSIRDTKTLSPYLFRAFYDWLVDSDVTPHLLVKINTPGVILPDNFKKEELIILSIGPNAVRNFDIGPRALSFNTRFSGVDAYIEIPYNAMLEIISREDQVGFPINLWFKQDSGVEDIADVAQDSKDDVIDFDALDAEDNEVIDFDPKDKPSQKDDVKKDDDNSFTLE